MTMYSISKQLLGLAACFAVCFFTAGIGAVASSNAPSFYRLLEQPGWAPPGWLFGPVWTLLFSMMAISAWLVWRARGFSGARLGLLLFAAQLIVNALWSWLFFAFQMGAAALLDIALLWMLITATICAFWSIHRFAALLLVPYLAWVSFAGALNWALLLQIPQPLLLPSRAHRLSYELTQQNELL